MKNFFIFAFLVIVIGLGSLYYLKTNTTILVRGTMVLTSPEFENGGVISEKFSCNGQNVNPTLNLFNIPPDANSLVLILTDIDSTAKNFTHWILYNMPPTTSAINEAEIPPGAEVGVNDNGTREYYGPCSPLGIHRYYFRLYALNILIPGGERLDINAINKLMKGHIIAKGEIYGQYVRR